MEKVIHFYVTLSLLFIVVPSSSMAKLEKIKEATKEDGSLSILVLGDWGRKGSYNQSKVAKQMGKTGEELKVDFIISTGDNFYETGLKGVHDTAFFESFSDIYTAPSLQKQWYNVLGNHDYRGNVEAQLSPELRQLDHKWFCQRSYVVGTGTADFFFVDTSPFVDEYFDESKWTEFDWKGVLPRDNYLSNLLQDVESALKESNASWKIVVGHHPIKSVGHHGNTKEIELQLLPILLENNVDLYVNGHDHCLEHISNSDGYTNVDNIRGSKAWKGEISFSENSKKDLKFFYDGQGFISLRLNRAKLQVDFYDIFGRIMHQWSRVKGMYSAF